MASLIKNQILKHLSKFTKNLSTDKISLSTLKGEGELSNLELDEHVLTELLDLPTWLNIKKATCNHVGIKIQWTKLKSQPIVLCLDEIIVEMETCETPREQPKTENDSNSSYRNHGKYGFIDRVIDGIFVRINSVLVKLVSKTFQASVELSRLTVQSMTPRWKPSENLRDSRAKDTENDAILLFKEIEWQNTRIHASSVDIGTTDFSSPLRLIANQAKIRITMKKKIADSSIIATRLQLYLDDLLWVLTKTQLKEAILYANSLSKIIENSSAQSKQRAAEKLQVLKILLAEDKSPQTLSPSHGPQPPPARSPPLYYDVKSTSYHVFINPINLHLCDDSNKDRLWNIEGGSMQITVYKFCMDFYPFHPAGSERDQWHNYETVGTRNSWVQGLFAEFKKDAVNIKSMAVSAQVTPLANQRQTKPGSTARQPQSPAKSKQTKLLESCCVVKVKDIAVYMVSTSSTKQSTLHKFLAADKQVPLPSDTCTSLIHLQYTDYFFPEEMQYPGMIFII
ncbi:hypothetical protein LOTGIDRAFT_104431 [Lottia gigantea]|uniref:Uncharacterized protein n=1 Tax=Lottia gigantea TaxID=225164 RepID=V4A183_LOTGI|nr:hypothetical protein LOTGIDRAFT_104431 [Lottia gigantea]ESO97583.1 hypothetical protein LOTGIDRAFT_104431 [Lottia gigantea]